MGYVSPTARPTYPTSRPTTYRPRFSTTTANPLSSKLKQAGCKCNKVNSVVVSSTDSRTLRKHKEELGRYKFDGTIFMNKPVYEKAVGTKKYYIYYFVAKKAWYIGDSIDQACPADPSTPKTKKWKRKNAFGFWGTD